ncbi:MAG TPA: biopolymer transporter ExbD [Myxococcota bacterium]|nr:biopolymer transporter ExbD [Myxococcota bacterium]
MSQNESPTPEGAEGFEPVVSQELADEIWGRKHRRRRKKHKLAGESIGHLNLTPMMDIMTILLVFLIQSFATEPANINVNLDLRPPQSTANVPMAPATKVVISAKEIVVDDEVVATMEEAKLEQGQKEIPAVRDALVARADHIRALEKLGGPAFDGKLLVVAHNTTPYALFTAVLYSAGQAKYGQFELVVMKKGEGG